MSMPPSSWQRVSILKDLNCRSARQLEGDKRGSEGGLLMIVFRIVI